MSKSLPNRRLALARSGSWHIAGSVTIVLIVAACAAAPVPPTNELLAAAAAIDSAERASIPDYSSSDLRKAWDKLRAANAAVQLEEMTTARRLAEQAQADAQLALAKSQSTKARLDN
jgi:hypothetical protein